MNYDDFVAQDRRLSILIFLCGLSERRANQFVLRTGLKQMGYDELVPTVYNDVIFLSRQGLVTTEKLPGDILLATVTDYGDQVSRGVARVQGVAVPASV